MDESLNWHMIGKRDAGLVQGPAQQSVTDTDPEEQPGTGQRSRVRAGTQGRAGSWMGTGVEGHRAESRACRWVRTRPAPALPPSRLLSHILWGCRADTGSQQRALPGAQYPRTADYLKGREKVLCP